MTTRPLRVSLLLIALLVASSCGRGSDTVAADELLDDDTGLIATFDVGYEVPLDIPEELQNTTSTDATAGEASDRANDPPDGLAMSDEGIDEPVSDDASATADEPVSDDASATADEPVSGDANATTADNDSEAEWPDDPQLRDDGLLFVRSPETENGQWTSIALLAPDGEIVWSYSACDDFGCTHDDIIVLANGNVAVTATSMVDGRLVDNVLELEPVIGDSCASQDWCTGVARSSRLNVAVPEGSTAAIKLISAAEDYSSWDVVWIADGSTAVIPAL